MKHDIAQLLTRLLASKHITVPVMVSRPEHADHGEYTTNIAMVVAKQEKVNPITFAKEIVDYFAEIKKAVEADALYQKVSEYNLNGSTITVTVEEKQTINAIYRLEVAGPGFINVFLTEAKLSNQVARVLEEKETVRSSQIKRGLISDAGMTRRQTSIVQKRIMVEFAHPNTHKAFHIGHLRNITTGECMVRFLESQGVSVVRANYQGDVGLHVAKCLYGTSHMPSVTCHGSRVLKNTDDGNTIDVGSLPIQERVEFLATAYVYGHQIYEKDQSAKLQIEDINKQIYAQDPAIYPLYEETRKWSLEYFDGIYKRVGTHFDRYYFESEVYESGKNLVMEGLARGIFEKSDGAIIYPGEKYGLHNRVFITSQGTPTYEGKDMGLAKLQMEEYHPESIIHCVASEQTAYFQVIFRALEDLLPETKGREKHLIYGWVKLKEGKMSSRTGNVVLGEWLLEEVRKSINIILDNSMIKYDKDERDSIAEACAIAAVKYAFLKVSTRQEIAFDIQESVSLEGDSGPYLLYTYARCASVLKKAEECLKAPKPQSDKETQRCGDAALQHCIDLNPEEHLLSRHIGYFDDIVSEAAENYSPNILCTYLFQLAQLFNAFYAKHSILDSLKPSKPQSDKETQRCGDAALQYCNFRLVLTQATAVILRRGLYLLGIPTVERM